MTPVPGVVEVVAGVIRDARGRILLTRRTAGRDLAGLWEFPGGKREPGESAEAALTRELHEELGIAVEPGEPLIRVPQQYPHKRLRLDVRHIASWRGSPHGHEGQALAWVPPHKLAGYAMPPADRPVIAALLQADRYLVTPEPGEDDAVWLASLQRALEGGIQRVQLRAHAVARDRWHGLAGHAVGLCRASGAEVLLNGDSELAEALLTGVHLRAVQLPDADSRQFHALRAAGQTLAASCHTLGDLRAADRLGCDFAVLGPVLATPSHPDTAGIGWDRFAALREQVSLPIYAIGGLRPVDIDVARAHGAQGIAAIRALWPAPTGFL